MKKIQWFLALALMVYVFASCTRDEEEENGGCGVSNVSAANTSRSHNQGQNCLSCHRSEGSGKGCFTAAGTVYKTDGSIQPNTIIRLYTQPNGQGELRATINGDNLGNFFTTNTINYSGGLYPAVQSASGEIAYMPSSITSGACNSCHNNSQNRIRVD